jgi:hypothetical protein
LEVRAYDGKQYSDIPIIYFNVITKEETPGFSISVVTLAIISAGIPTVRRRLTYMHSYAIQS